MIDLCPKQAKSIVSQCEDHFVNLEWRRDWEVSVHTTHTSKSQSWNGSHLSHEEDTRALHLDKEKTVPRMAKVNSLQFWLLYWWWRGSYVITDEDQGLLLVSLSRMMRTSIMSAKIEIHLPKAWEMMRWIEHSTKFPNHPSHVESKGGDFLDGSLSQHSPYTMVEQTLWSMWVTLTREWMCTPRIRPWCARCSPPI